MRGVNADDVSEWTLDTAERWTCPPPRFSASAYTAAPSAPCRFPLTICAVHAERTLEHLKTR